MKTSFDKDVGNYEAKIARSEQRVEELKPWLEKLPQDIVTIADVGCGAGYYSKYFLDKGLKPTAIDRLKSAFQFHNEIEFLNLDLAELQKNRKFDAVFCAHTLEHCPDPYTAILQMKEIIREGGYLILIVPPYVPEVCNFHWITGWNIGQLAIFLVSCGFDCTNGVFSQFGINVCGFGKKIFMEQTKFNLHKSLKYLPTTIQNQYFKRESEYFINGKLAFADKSKSWLLATDLTFAFSNFNFQNHIELKYDKKEWKSTDNLNQKIFDLTHDQITLIVLVEGNSSAVRLAIGDGDSKEPFTNCADLWISLKPGFNIKKYSVFDFKVLRGKPCYSKITQLSFGGSCEKCNIYAWIFDVRGRQLF